MRRSARSWILLAELTVGLAALTAVLSIGGAVAAERTIAGVPGVVPHIWALLPSVAGVVCLAASRWNRPAALSTSVGLIWSVAVLGIWSIGFFFVPAALAGAAAALSSALRSPRRSPLAIVWFGIGLTALCALDLLYARSQTREVRWAGGYFASRIDVAPVIVYGARLFALLVSTTLGVAIVRKLVALRR